MANTVYGKKTEESKRLRKEAGAYVKGFRVKAGLSQLDLANKLGLTYYTMVSQVKALDVDVATFAKTMLRYNDPHTFSAIFEPKKKD